MSSLAQSLTALEHKVYLATQPIFDVRNNIFGHELLFRSGSVNSASFVDGNRATAQVIHNALMEFDLSELVGNSCVFINFPRDLLLDGIAELMLPPERIVLELLETETIDAVLVECLSRLQQSGYQVALDDFIFTPQWEPLLGSAQIIKMDVLGKSNEQIIEEMQPLRRYKARFLAEKIESHEQYEFCKQSGFTYFQGYYFCKPSISSKTTMPDNHLALLELLSRLQQTDINVAEIESLISKTVSLNYKLFRYINSPYFGLRTKCDSIQRAVVYFGINRIKQLATLVTLTSVSNKPSELIITGLSRARSCELLARACGLADPDVYFVVGLFSILDALLDHPMQEILGKLPLSPETVSALLGADGPLGSALACTIACERNEQDNIGFMGLPLDSIYAIQQQARIWARSVAVI
jgi:EAL and modified HD-GYP domain-containing signal transduction protein